MGSKKVCVFFISAYLLMNLGVGCGSGSSNALPNPQNTAPPVPGVSGKTFQLSTDPITGALGQHQTAVEPSILANGNTLVSAFQIGRIVSGAADALGWATSTNGGNSWATGLLPGLTVSSGGTDQEVTDSVVAYDALHATWIVSSLIFSTSQNNSALVVNRSSDGLSWSNPVTVSTSTDYDKDWIACDNGATSPHRGTCYVEWDDVQNGQKIDFSVSTDGGLTWSAPQSTADSATGLAGQFAIQPNGNVIVPFFNSSTSSPEILMTSSSDGGQTWGSSSVLSSTESSSIPTRGETDPQVSIDSNGKVYVAWYDCRFESNCSANDIVLSTSTDGTTWSSPALAAVDPVGSGLNHFLPAIAVSPTNTNQVALTYYVSNSSSCTGTSCQVTPEFSNSDDGGTTFSAPTPLWQSFALSEVATSDEGPMLGDYFGIAIIGTTAFPAFSAPLNPGSTALDQQIFASVIQLR